MFIPILLMGGIIGRLFREFAVTLSVAILVSLAISLTTTPMMCALFLRRPKPIEAGEGWFGRISERAFRRCPSRLRAQPGLGAAITRW